MCQFQNMTTIAADRVAAQPAPTATWREQLVAQAVVLDTFVFGVMVANGQSATGRAYLLAAEARRSVLGTAGAIGWQFGVALAQARDLGSRVSARGGRPAALAMLGQALAPLGEELGHTMLLVGLGQITFDDAALLLCLPPAEVRSRIGAAIESMSGPRPSGERFAA
jgi:hypothetical protein